MTMQCAQRIGRAVEHGDGHARRNFPPAAPAMKPGQIVGPHEPHEPMVGMMALQKSNRVDAVEKLVFGFHIQHADARMLGDGGGTFKTHGIGCQVTGFFQRVLG